MKGMGIEKITALVGVMIAGGFMVAIFAGPMLAAAQSGQSELNNVVNQNRTIAIETASELADASHYVWDRAHGCDKVRQRYGSSGGYPGLADTPYTKYPPCVDSIRASEQGGVFQSIAGATSAYDDGLIGDAAGALYDRLDGGTDMEAKHGRIYFTIQEEIELTSFEKGYDNVNAPNYDFFTLAVSEEKSYLDRVEESNCEDRLADPSEGTEGFLLAFDEDSGADAGNRVATIDNNGQGKTVEGIEDEKDNKWLVSAYPYCKEKLFIQAYLSHGAIREHFNGNAGRVEAKLCPGDRGYIQVNKNVPKNFEEANAPSEERGVVGLALGESYHPFIQITHTTDESCNNPDADNPSPTDRVSDITSLESPSSGWGDVNWRGKQLEIHASADNPSQPTRIDIDDDSDIGDLKGCQIKIVDDSSGEVGVVNFTASQDKDEVTPIFRTGGLPPRHEEDSKDDGSNLDDNSNAETIYEDLVFDGRSIPRPDTNPDRHLGAIMTGENGNSRMVLWRDMLCIDASVDTSQKNGEWVMCGGSDNHHFPASPDHWTCIDGKDDGSYNDGWYPQEQPRNECDGNVPNRINGWLEDFSCGG